MKKILLLTILLSTVGFLSAQNTWTQLTNVGGDGRQAASSFAIGSYGYIGLGLNYETTVLESDFWQYDPTSNTWTQMANFGGTPRFASVSFVIGNCAYVGLGSDSYPNYSYPSD